MILHHLGVYLPHEDGFKVKSFYIGSAYGSICDDYGVNADEKSMDGDWFYSKKYYFLETEERTQKVWD